jgi:hypothetical protein
MNFIFSTFAHPIVGFVTLGLVFLFYFGEAEAALGHPPGSGRPGCGHGPCVG